MIIFCGCGYIFVYIFKIGGMVFVFVMEVWVKVDDILIGDMLKVVKCCQCLKGVKMQGCFWKYFCLVDVEGLVGWEDFEIFFILILVCNLWDRVVSYYYWLQGQGFDYLVVDLVKIFGFVDFVVYLYICVSLYSVFYGSYMIDSMGIEYCDLFVWIEEFVVDIVLFEDYLGFKFDLFVVNILVWDWDWCIYYDENIVRIVLQVCVVDIV